MDKRTQHRGIRRVVSTHLPTIFGIFDLIGFERANMAKRERETALVMTLGDLQEGVPFLRIHSQCLTGEVLGSLRCDCRGQLEVAMSTIAEQGSGLVIYLHQEGRGIGLMAKLKPTPCRTRVSIRSKRTKLWVLTPTAVISVWLWLSCMNLRPDRSA
jgi:GTP cyclohydrolase II